MESRWHSLRWMSWVLGCEDLVRQELEMTVLGLISLAILPPWSQEDPLCHSSSPALALIVLNTDLVLGEDFLLTSSVQPAGWYKVANWCVLLTGTGAAFPCWKLTRVALYGALKHWWPHIMRTQAVAPACCWCEVKPEPDVLGRTGAI